jgi:hypothetical protein
MPFYKSIPLYLCIHHGSSMAKLVAWIGASHWDGGSNLSPNLKCLIHFISYMHKGGPKKIVFIRLGLFASFAVTNIQYIWDFFCVNLLCQDLYNVYCQNIVSSVIGAV